MSIRSSLVRKVVATEMYTLDEVFTLGGRIYTFLNPVSYLSALKSKDTFASFDGIFADGSLFAWSVLLLYHHSITRTSFDMTSMAPKLFQYANDNKKSVCVIATRQDVLDRAISKLSDMYPDIEWRGCRNGYMRGNEEKNSAIRKIVEDNADFLIVGMGTRLQEKFLLACRTNGYRGIGFTCGGFIHQFVTKDAADYYPKWMNEYNLRFIYRMYKEPYTRKRYAKAAIAFPVRFFAEKIKCYFR